MKIIKARTAGAAALAAVVGVAVTAAPAADAQRYDVPKPITISAKAKGKKPAFRGPSRVERGAKLTVVNKDNPRKIGPHTFSLVKPSRLPKGKAGMEECEQLEGVCGDVARAHKIDFETFEIRKPDVDAGKKGWNKHFGKRGDSFFTETEGERESRKVTAKVGSRLTFLCVVHPTMVKRVKVVR